MNYINRFMNLAIILVFIVFTAGCVTPPTQSSSSSSSSQSSNVISSIQKMLQDKKVNFSMETQVSEDEEK